MSQNYSISSNSTNDLLNIDDIVETSNTSCYPPPMFYSNAEQTDLRKPLVSLILSHQIDGSFPHPSSICNKIILEMEKSNEHSSSTSLSLTLLKEKPRNSEGSKVSADTYQSSCFRKTIYFLIEIICLCLFMFFLALFIFDWFYNSFRTDWLEYLVSNLILNGFSSVKNNESNMTIRINQTIRITNPQIEH